MQSALLLVAACQSRHPADLALTPSRLRAFCLVQHEHEEGRWAPGLSPGQAPSDRGRQHPPRPGCLIPCHPVSPSRCRGRGEGCCYYTFYYSARHAKGPLPLGKGP